MSAAIHLLLHSRKRALKRFAEALTRTQIGSDGVSLVRARTPHTPRVWAHERHTLRVAQALERTSASAKRETTMIATGWGGACRTASSPCVMPRCRWPNALALASSTPHGPTWATTGQNVWTCGGQGTGRPVFCEPGTGDRWWPRARISAGFDMGGGGLWQSVRCVGEPGPRRGVR